MVGAQTLPRVGPTMTTGMLKPNLWSQTSPVVPKPGPPDTKTTSRSGYCFCFHSNKLSSNDTNFEGQADHDKGVCVMPAGLHSGSMSNMKGMSHAKTKTL
mmetsp:Transcript_19690/g.55554  ORF Transcript_19690/g.55554 Transcript_19690/m.55554 type:complete len:100 (-) Transcript_19690:326-625(-)